MKIKRVLVWVGVSMVAMRAPAQISAKGVIYVNTYKAMAMAEMQRSGVPAAITLAQGLHETEAGTSDLVRESNNHFGIKCKADWKGQVVYHDDDSRGECFRSYATAADSYRDHSDFLRGSQRYAFLFTLDPTDYEGWAYGLKKAGYATNTRYSQILIRLIRDYNLEQYTMIAMGRMPASDEAVLRMPGMAPGQEGTPIAVNGGTAAAQNGAGDSAMSATAATSAVAAGQASVTGSVSSSGSGAAPGPSYPEGEFTINRTRVVYAGAGVSLLAIANQYDIPLGRLLEFNDLKDEDVLMKGQLIFLQRKRREGATVFHLVREGEDLYGIAQAEGVRLEDILEMNQLALGEQPVAGEKIYLRGSAPMRPRLVMNTSN